MSAPRIVEPRTAAEMAAMRALCWEYRDYLLSQPPADRAAVTNAYPIDVYQQVVDGLEAKHRAPHGAMGLALGADGAPLGCGMSQMLNADDIEFKRIYLRPEARGLGLGRAMVEFLIETARPLGAKRVLMDTGRVLTGAQALYEKMGFRRRGPYADVPEHLVPLLVFYEMDL